SRRLGAGPGGVGGHIRYSSVLWDARTIARLVEPSQPLREGIVMNPDLPISAIPMLTASERLSTPRHRELVRPCNPFAVFEDSEVDQSIPQRFEKQVAKYPERIAIRAGHTVWSYEALNQAANRVATAVGASSGVDGTRVALVLDHEAPMVAGILGVLKAGGAYVPMDPTYPRERLCQIVTDALTTAVLTNRKNLPLAADVAG